MLISFSVENFRSIRDLQTLNLRCLKTDEHLAWSNSVEIGKYRLAKTVAVYGPNGSGKSNLIRAMIWFRMFVLLSSKEGQAGEQIAVEPFLLSDFSENQPSYFEVEFFWKNYEYRYGFTATSHAVETEWLFRSQKGSKAVRLFARQGADITLSATHFKEGKGLESRTRNNALFLSVCGQFAGPEAEKVLLWFQQFRSISGLNDDSCLGFTAERLSDEQHRGKLLKFAQQADFNITNLSSVELTEDELPKNLPPELHKRVFLRGRAFAGIKTYHSKRDKNGELIGEVEFDLAKDESQGTQKFIALSGPITHTLEEGSILIIDELEARLHPKLTQAIIDLFHSPVNEKNAQLICATHDVTLLDPERFRRDQIWFCEKGEDGATSLFSLAEFDPQKVRATTKFSRQYMLGLFGAVPRLAHFQEAAAKAVKD